MISLESTITETELGWILKYPKLTKIKTLGKSRFTSSEDLIIIVTFLPNCKKWQVTESTHSVSHQTI